MQASDSGTERVCLWTQPHRVDRPTFVQRRGIPVGEEVDHWLTTGCEPQDEIFAGS
jgi:hypothetical protein